MASDKPGKLKFNAAMFNPAAMKPGAMNPKLAAKKKAAAENREETKPLQSADFDKPKRPARAKRVNSRPTLSIDEDWSKDDALSRSILSTSIIDEEKAQGSVPPAVDIKNENENDENNEKNENNENENENENNSNTPPAASPLSPNIKELADGLSNKFGNRPKQSEMRDKGLVDTKIASSLAQTKNALEKKQKQQQLQEKVNARRQPDDMVDQGYLHNDPTKVHGSLHEPSTQLSKGLEQRSDKEFLEHTNILKRTNMADSLQPNAQNVEDKLQKREARDTITHIKSPLQATAEAVDRLKKTANVKSQLQERSDIDSLTRSGVIKSTAAPTLHGSVQQLEKQMKTDHVRKELNERSTTDQLSDAGIMKLPSMAPSLQTMAVSLERNIKQDAVSKGTKDRATTEQLEKQGIVKNPNVANSLQSTATDLDRSLKSDQVSKQTKERSTKEQLQGKGVLKQGNLANSLQGTASELEKSIKTDSVRKDMSKRSDIESLTKANVVKNPQLASSLHKDASDLEHQLKTDRVSTKLKGQKTSEELAKSGVLKSPQMAASIQPTAGTLEHQLKTDTMKKKLAVRGDEDEYTKRGLLSPRGTKKVPAQFAGQAFDLDKELRKDAVSKGMKDRRTAEELEQSGILYSSSQARALQGSAQELENRLLERRKSAFSDTDLPEINDNANESDDSSANNLNNKLSRPPLGAQSSRHERVGSYRPMMVRGGFFVDEVPQRVAKAIDKQEDNNNNNDDNESESDSDISDLRVDAVVNTKKLNLLIAEYNTKREYDSGPSHGSMSQSPTQTDVDMQESHELNDAMGADPQDNRARTRKFLNRRLSRELRPTPETMQLWGLIPKNYFDDPNAAVRAQQAKRNQAKQRLSLKYQQRASPNELVARGLAYESFWQNEAQDVERNRRQQREQAKLNVAEKLNPKRRPSVTDLVKAQIFPEDSEVVQELKRIAKRHHRMESAVNDLAQQLPFEQRVAEVTAANMMQHLAETEEDVLLCDDPNCTNPRHLHEKQKTGRRGSIEENSENNENNNNNDDNHVQWTENAQGDGSGSDDSDEKLRKKEAQQRRRRLSTTIERTLQRRPTEEHLQEQGILKHSNIAASLRGAAVELEELMGDRLPQYVLQHHRILKRPSIARSLQPQAEQLEHELKNVMQKAKDMEFENVDNGEHPLYRRESSNESSGNPRTRARRASSAFGTLKNQLPTWYRHDIAGSLQETANTLHKKRVSIQLNQKFAARPSRQDLIDNRILYNAAMANGLQDKAYILEEILRQRVPENYLTKIGVLRHTGDDVAPSIQPTAADLETLLMRRPSLFDAMTNDMKKLLADYQRDNPNDVPPIDEEERDDDYDRRQRKAQRKHVGKIINRRLSLRMTRDELVERGFVPKDYWDDPDHAYFMKGVNKKLHMEDLARGIKNRSKPDEIYARGITRREWLEMDYEKAQQVVAKKIQYQRSNLKTKLHEHWGLGVVKELEDREILEPGYLEQAVDNVRSGHRRAASIVKEIQTALVNRPEYNEVIARGLVTDLQPENEYGDDDSSDDDSMSDDDEEQHQRLLDLEYRIGHRPSMADLVEMKILHYHHTHDDGHAGVAPRIQSSAVGLQSALGRRKSIEDLSALGIFSKEDLMRMGLDDEQIDRIEKNGGDNDDDYYDDDDDDNDIRQQGGSREERAANENEKQQFGKKKKKKRGYGKGKELTDDQKKLENKLDRRRRPTMMDLELRGIVPEGYFANVETALHKKTIRRNSVVNDLSTRLRDRPELSDLIARKILDKAMKAADKRDELIKKQTQKENIMVKALLEKKLQMGRPSVADLQSRNIVRQGYDPRTQHAQVNRTAVELENQATRKKLEANLNARMTQEELLDKNYLHHKIGGETHVLAHSLHEVANDLEHQITHRIGEDALKKDNILFSSEIEYTKHVVGKKLDPKRRPDINDMMGRGLVRREYYDPNVEVEDQQNTERKALSKIKTTLEKMIGNGRSSAADLQDRGVVPHGAFDDVDAARHNKHQRLLSIQDEVQHNLQSRPKHDELVQNGILKMPMNVIEESERVSSRHREDRERTGLTPPPSRDPKTGRRGSVDRSKRSGNSSSSGSGGPLSPTIPAVHDGRHGHGQYHSVAARHAADAKEQVMQSLASQNRNVLEPVYQVDVLVAEPELKDNEIYSSQLAFMNVLDGLEKIIGNKMSDAKDHLNKMTKKAEDLSLLKNLLRKLQAFGVAVLESMDDNPEFDNVEFKSCGDLDKDIENVTKQVLNVQQELFDLDENYFPLHKKIRQLQGVQDDMTKFYDEYRIKLSQLKRIERRIQSEITENRTNKDSSQEAIKATSERQGLMLSKITNKIVETQDKIEKINFELSKLNGISGMASAAQRAELTEEATTCRNFLTGLMEFKKGLKRLRAEQQSRIKHLEMVVKQLIQQRAMISEQLALVRKEAIDKLDDVRTNYIIPMTFEPSTSSTNDNNNGNNNNNNGTSLNDGAVSTEMGDMLSSSTEDSDMFGSGAMAGMGMGMGMDNERNNGFENEYDNLAPLSMMELMHKREKYMNKVFRKIHDLESRALTTSSSDYLRGLTEIRELQIILANPKLKYFYNIFVNQCNEILHDCVLAATALFEQSQDWNSRVLQEMAGIQLLKDIITKNSKFHEKNHHKYLETIQTFVSSLPDKEVVIMQVGRHLATSLPFRAQILDESQEKYHTKLRNQNNNNNNNNTKNGDNDNNDESSSIRIQKFALTRVRELMASILDIYGSNTFNSVRAAVDNDVVAQVRPSRAAKIIVNCVYGLDVSL